MQLLKAYQRLHLYVPNNLGYILACKLMAGRPEKDFADIEALCQTLGIQNRVQAQYSGSVLPFSYSSSHISANPNIG